MCLRAKGMPESTATFSVEAAGQVYIRRTSLYTSGETSTTTPTCPSRSTGAYAMHGAASGSTPSNCTTDRALSSSSKPNAKRAEVIETMLYGCVTWSPRACHYDALRRAHHRFLTRCIGWRKHNRANHPISYLDTLLKTGSESIEATLCRRRILFEGLVARMGDTRLPKCVMFGEMVGGAGCAESQEKERMGWFLDDLRAFGINADQWTTAAQTEGEWRRTAEQGAEHFMAKWIAAEKPRLDSGMQWYARTWREGPGRG